MPPPREKNATVLQARSLRRDMTLPEGLLWQVLRSRPEGFKFRRQHPIGRCIVDFYCPAAKLAVESLKTAADQFAANVLPVIR